MSSFQRKHWDTAVQDRSKGEISTAQKFYDLQQSQKHYQQLLEENIWLKQQIERSRYQEPQTCPHCRSCCQCSVQEPEPLVQTSDMVLWSMLERNKYLEEKIGKLKHQYEKQSKTIGNIRSSDKWKNRFVCGPQTNSCYQDKYLQLLRVRSPFY